MRVFALLGQGFVASSIDKHEFYFGCCSGLPAAMQTGDGSDFSRALSAMNIKDNEILPILRAALERGQHLRMSVNGWSMVPFVHDGDIVELESLRGMPRLGDVVQVERQGPTAIIHRVVRIDGERFFLRGDAQTCTEGPFTEDAVLGKVTTCKHGNSVRSLDRGVWRLAGLLWLHGGSVRVGASRVARRLREFAKLAPAWGRSRS